METTELDSFESAVEGLLAPAENDDVEEAEFEEVDESEDEAEDEESEDDSEDEYEDTEEAEESEPEYYSVKVGGIEEKVTLEDLKRGYSGQQYVQKGMQENAQMRKQVEAIYADLVNERQQIGQALQLAQSGALQPPQPPDKSLKETDPMGYWNQKEAYDEAQAQWNSQMQMLQQQAAQQGQAQEAAQRAYLERELETLKTLIPEFSEPEKASAVRDNLVAVGTDVYGYSAEEIAGVVDHRAILVLHDAVKWRELQAGKTKAQVKGKTKSRRTAKPGAKKIRPRKAAERQTREKLKQSGSIEDALSLMFKE